MISSYAQKPSTIQKFASFKAAFVLDSSSQGESLQRKAGLTNNAAQLEESLRPNNTGMPDDLKTGIESLSGFSMDDVRVHYNSSKPATVQALAYTQGTDIHVAPGQEKCLPHEAWHVAQQMAGRVSPTTNINGMPVNDNAALEHEADVMGEKAVQCQTEKNGNLFVQKNEHCSSAPVQMVREKDFKENPKGFMEQNTVLCNYRLGLAIRMGWNDTLIEKFMDLMNDKKIDSRFFVLTPLDVKGKKVYVLTPAVEKYDLSELESFFKEKLMGLKCSSNENGANVKIGCCAECVERIESALRLIHAKPSFNPEEYIEAGYFPYKGGPIGNFEDSVGHVEVKKVPDGVKDPNFIFTGDMQGCAIVSSIDSDDEPDFTIWHFQSPGDKMTHASRFRREKNVTDWFGVEEYGNPFVDPKKVNGCPRPEATNFLWWDIKSGSWKILSQNNIIYYGAPNSLIDLRCFSSVSRDLNLNPSSPQRKIDISKKIYSGLLDNFLTKADLELESIGSDDYTVLFRRVVHQIVTNLKECLNEETPFLLKPIVEDGMNYLKGIYEKFPESDKKCCKRIMDEFGEILKDKKFFNPLIDDYVSSAYLQDKCLPEAMLGRSLEKDDVSKIDEPSDLRIALEGIDPKNFSAFLYKDLKVVKTIVSVLKIPDCIFRIINQSGSMLTQYEVRDGLVRSCEPTEEIASSLPIVVIRNINKYHFEREKSEHSQD